MSQKGDIAKAINYALSQWVALTLYVDDGAVEIDNNAAERALRAVALGRKSSCTSVPSLIVIRRRHVADQLDRDATDSWHSSSTRLTGCIGDASDDVAQVGPGIEGIQLRFTNRSVHSSPAFTAAKGLATNLSACPPVLVARIAPASTITQLIL